MPSDLKGLVLSRLGRRHFAQPVVTASSPRGETMYWVGPPGGQRDAGPGTDFHALANGYASVTPLRVDLGDDQATDEVGTWLSGLH
jgi:5'-nucleotidase